MANATQGAIVVVKRSHGKQYNKKSVVKQTAKNVDTAEVLTAWYGANFVGRMVPSHERGFQ